MNQFLELYIKENFGVELRYIIRSVPIMRFIISFIFLLLPVISAYSQDTACDQLAASPLDVNKHGSGVVFANLDAERAIPACLIAVHDFPDLKRFQYQLARSLSKANRFAEAAAYYESLANSGYATAQNDLGVFYASGRGVPKDILRALDLLGKAADQGLAIAKTTLKAMGKSVEVAAYKAFLAADASDKVVFKTSARPLSSGKPSLGEIFEYGLGVDPNVKQARAYYQVDADRGDLDAQVRLGRLDEKNGDFSKAFEAYTQANTAGSRAGLLALANLHLKMIVDPPFSTQKFTPSLATAVSLYKQAIARGSNAASMNLAVLYQQGYGLTKDRTSAISLYNSLLGTAFDAPARLGLLLDSLNDIIETERQPRRDIMKLINIFQDEKQSDIAVEAIKDRVSIAVTDSLGHRVFSGYLSQGEEYRPPIGREDLIVWIKVGTMQDSINIKIGEQIISISDDCTGVRLNHAALSSRVEFAIIPRDVYAVPRTLTDDQRVGSRVILKNMNEMHVYLHNDSDSMGWEDDGSSAEQFDIPNIGGLRLEVSAAKYNSSQPGSVNLYVDGWKTAEIHLGGDCEVSLLPIPAILRPSNLPTQIKCNNIAIYRRSLAYKKIVASNVLLLKKHIDETIEGEVNEFGRLADKAIVSIMNTDGLIDKVYDARKTIVKMDIRQFGFNSFETLFS